MSDDVNLIDSRFLVCYLVVGKLRDMPRMAIESFLRVTKSRALVGYLNESDLPDIPFGDRVSTLQLDVNSIPGLQDVRGESSEYFDFSEVGFYRIVQLKWQLLLSSLEMNFEFVIYCDTDVLWLKNPLVTLANTFDARKNVSIQIQNFTQSGSEPKLCMGFVAFRKCEETLVFIEECRDLHMLKMNGDSKVGDDDIVTELYLSKGQPSYLYELPQFYFPVGMQLNAYSKRNLFPGLSSPVPYIYHANYVVGLNNKRLLMRLFLNLHKVKLNKSKLGVGWKVILLLKRSRLMVGTFRLQIKTFLNRRIKYRR